MLLYHLFFIPGTHPHRNKQVKAIVSDAMTVSVISSDDAKHDHKRVGGDDANTNLQRRLIVRYERVLTSQKPPTV